MLTALDAEGVKHIPYLEDINTLRSISDEGKMYCPDCQTSVILVAGTRRVHHFRHRSNVECTYDSEPETMEHAQGKVHIYNWLKKKYPEAKVELEYKIKETNQRADVFVIFPDREKWAFEIQCSPISGELWKKRSNLYKQADVKDFWILGENLHSYGITNGEVDTMKNRLKDLPLTIFKETGYLLYFDTNSLGINGFYEFKDNYWESDTVLYAEGNQFSLYEINRIENFWGDKQVKILYNNWLEEKKRLLKASQDEEKRQLEEKRMQQQLEKKLIEDAIRYQNELNNFNFNDIAAKMNKYEKTLFNNLVNKHKLTEQTFPGICKIYVKYTNLIITPYPLWQLYIYDKYIYSSKEGKSKVWVPQVVEDIKSKFRKTFDKKNDANYSFAIYRYFSALKEANIVIQLSRKNSKYYQVNSNKFPNIKSFRSQSYIAYYLSIYNHIKTNNGEKFRSEMNKAWIDYMNISLSPKGSYIKETDYIKKNVNNNYENKNLVFHSIFYQYEQLQYILNLYSADSTCLNESEREFLYGFSKHTDYDKRITYSQWENYLKIKRKIEEHYNISLDS